MELITTKLGLTARYTVERADPALLRYLDSRARYMMRRQSDGRSP